MIVVPQARCQVLEELHVSHPGETRIKGLAKSYVWRPRMDKDMERLIKGCQTCQIPEMHWLQHL